jgi:hypothetical protein
MTSKSAHILDDKASEMYWALVLVRGALVEALPAVGNHPKRQLWQAALTLADAAIAKAEVKS